MLDYEIVEGIFFLLMLGVLGALGIYLIWRGLVDLLSEKSTVCCIIPNHHKREKDRN
jgi:hypothetical protein